MADRNPAMIVNQYLSEKVEQLVPDYFGTPMFFLPTMPTDVDALYEGFPAAEGQTFAVYERMFKMRRAPFPHCKCEQVLYYLYKNDAPTPSEQAAALFNTTQAIYDLMDRGDESAEEINAWQKNNLDESKELNFFGTKFEPVFFHSFKVFQLEETRDIVDFATANSFIANKIIVDYEYHLQNFNQAQPVEKSTKTVANAGDDPAPNQRDLTVIAEAGNNMPPPSG